MMFVSGFHSDFAGDETHTADTVKMCFVLIYFEVFTIEKLNGKRFRRKSKKSVHWNGMQKVSKTWNLVQLNLNQKLWHSFWRKWILEKGDSKLFKSQWFPTGVRVDIANIWSGPCSIEWNYWKPMHNSSIITLSIKFDNINWRRKRRKGKVKYYNIKRVENEYNGRQDRNTFQQSIVMAHEMEYVQRRELKSKQNS